jgi:tellurite resistance protein
VEDEEARVAAVVFHEMTGESTNPEEMKADAAVAASGGRDLEAMLRDVAPHLNDTGRSMAVKAALLVALADGDFAQEEQHLVHGIARAVGLDDEGFRAVVAEVSAAQEAGRDTEEHTPES